MGFGTLFFGYFLLLNLTFFTFTDLISALVMALGFYKLSRVNKPFLGAFCSSLIFAGVGIFELVIQILDMFGTSDIYESMLSYTDMFRYVIIAVITLFMLKGIDEVADEVGLSELAKKARYSMPFSLTIYMFLAVLSIQGLQKLLGSEILPWLSVISLFAVFILIAVNLTTIYKAYMKICMPEDKDYDISEKPSKFEFINRHREHTKERQREYMEYKFNKMKQKSSKKKKK